MKKIGISLFRYPLGVSPSIINTAILLSRQDYEVHLFIEKESYLQSPIEFKEKNIFVHDIEVSVAGLRSLSTLNKKFNLFGRRIPIRGIILSFYSIFTSLSWKLLIRKSSLSDRLDYCLKHLLKDVGDYVEKTSSLIDANYVCIIGVEPYGLFASHLNAHGKNLEKPIPVIYYNLELLLEKECRSPVKKLIKSLEREASQKSFFTIIPDERRAKHLISDNKIPAANIVHVPVSALGVPFKTKTDYLRKSLRIPPGKKIILYAGNIIPWSMSLEVAQAAQGWGENKVLVLHTWKKDAGDDSYVKQIMELTGGGKVYLSLNPVSWEELPKLLSSADIGLVFYKNIGENFYETGSSSNKLAQYLQVGIPVITSDYPSFRGVVEEYGCGKTTNDSSEIEKKADEILSDYDAYRNNAFHCYEERYEFSKHFKQVMDRIKLLG